MGLQGAEGLADQLRRLSSPGKRMRLTGRAAPLLLMMVAAAGASGCRGWGGFGGAGYDPAAAVEEARRFPATQSASVSVTTVEVPAGTFRQEFDSIFDDFPRRGRPSQGSQAAIEGSSYTVSYENYLLRLFRGESVIFEQRLPRVFYMHPVNSGLLPGESGEEDLAVFRVRSRATTGLHYVCVVSGRGEVIFERVMHAYEVWDITATKDGEIIVGGARTKTVITGRLGPAPGR